MTPLNRKASWFIEVIVLGIVTVVNEREITKAMNSTVVVPTGIINDVRPDSRKDPIPIVRREVGSIIEVAVIIIPINLIYRAL